MRILVLTHRLPYAPNRGDRIRAFHVLRALRRAHDVELVSLVHDADEAGHAQDLVSMGIPTTIAPVTRLRNAVRGALALPGPRSLTHCLLDSPALVPALRAVVQARPPDLVLAYCSGMARFALEPPLQAFPFVLDMVDVDSAKWGALAETAPLPQRWIYARERSRLEAFERRATDAARCTLVVNERERALLAAIAPAAMIAVIENGVDVQSFRTVKPPAESLSAVFCGVMNYAPNEAAAIWVAREVWPRVSSAVPGAKLLLVGSHPTAKVQALAGGTVTVTGAVPETRTYLWDAAVGLAPLATARGIQNKVLEAVAAGLPVVATPAVFGGLPPEVLPACSEAASAERFADEVIRLLRLSPAGRRAIAASATMDGLTWEARLAGLSDLLETARTRSTS